MKYPIRDPFDYFFACRRFVLWHRHLPDDFRLIDIDAVGIENGRIAYVIEATKSNPDGKPCAVTKLIAEATGSFAFVVQIPRIDRIADRQKPWGPIAEWFMRLPPPESLVVRQVYPQPCWQRRLTWAEFERLLRDCRQKVRAAA